MGYGYIWSYNITPKNITIPTTRLDNIEQYTIEGEYIKTWENLYVASRTLNLDISSIQSCCEGKFANSYNFIWVYKKDDNIESRVQQYKDGLPSRVFQYDLAGKLVNIFNSTADIVARYNYMNSGISECCTGKIKSYKKSIWLYEKDISLIKERVEKLHIRKNTNRVKQSNLDGSFIKIFANAREAAKAVNRSVKSIQSACVGTTKSSAGFLWEYCI